MPLYEYECEACGHRFEVIQKFSDAPLETCPKCGSRVHKLQSAPAFQFKGTGWYVTDYAKKDQGAAAKSGDAKSDGKPSESSASDKSEASQKSDKTDKTDKSDKPADSSSSASATSAPASGTTPAKNS